MTRAPRLSPQERRTALIEATTPLVLEHGSGVSTRQIAEAAGVAEGTIFRVFDSKEDLLHACATRVLSRDGLAESLARIPAGSDLPTTIALIGRALTDRINDVRAVVALLHEQGRGRGGPHHHAHDHAHDHAGGPAAPEASSTCRRPDPRAVHAAVVETVASALAPHADALRTTPRVAANALIALTFGAGHAFAGDPALTDVEALTDLILHGIQKDA